MGVLISADVILKSNSGSSISKAQEPITSMNIDKYKPSQTSTKIVGKFFAEMGFEIRSSETSLSISGDIALFERIFSVNIDLKSPVGSKNSYPEWRYKPKIPTQVAEIVDGVFFPDPAEFFDSG